MIRRNQPGQVRLNERMDLVQFDTAQAPTVAAWPTSATESQRWCGRPEFPIRPEVIEEWSKAQDVQAFLLLAESEAVGYGELWLDEEEHEVELAHLIVAPTHRRKGIGRHLTEALSKEAEQQPTAGTICLRVHPDNAAAARVYQSAGYQQVDEATAAEWNARQPVAYQWLVLKRRNDD
jgi:ribosomal protein S18 acetylase RimI-like enzyme